MDLRGLVGRSLLIAAVIASTVVVPVDSLAASPTCRVRNVTQDTAGRSLIRMVARAHDGDEVQLRGVCHGSVLVGVDVVIRGMGDEATITGRRRTRALFIRWDATVTVKDVIVRRGVAHAFGSSSLGGGIFNRGHLELAGVILRQNSAGGSGGALASFGELDIVRSRIRDNEAGLKGGGVVSFGDAHLSLTDSVVALNVAGNGGGGIANKGTVEVAGSKVSGNASKFHGGGIDNEGVATLTDSTVSNNRILGRGIGGGIYNEGDVSLLGTSSVTGNAPDDCVGTPAC